MDLKKELLSKINVREFWSKEFPEWDGKHNSKVSCPFKDKHKNGDSNPSLSLSITGEYNCFSCGAKGTSVIGYYTDKYTNGSFSAALSALYSKYIGKSISKSLIRKFCNTLGKSPKKLSAITQKRSWSQSTIEKLGLGWNEETKRVTIPIYKEGICVDIREHDSLRLEKGEWRVPVLGQKGSKNGNWFPEHLNEDNLTFLFEGEPDCITGIELELNAATLTGGASIWAVIPLKELKRLEGRDVVICFDSDTAGRDAAKDLGTRLASVDISSLRVVEVPQGKDLTDWIVNHGGTRDKLMDLVNHAPYLIRADSKEALPCHLSETSDARYANKWLRSEVLVSGKRNSPYTLPERISFRCNPNDGYCQGCPCAKTGESEYVVLKEDAHTLDWLYTKDYGKLLSREMGLPTKCPKTIDVKTYRNIEEIQLIPSLSDRRSLNSARYVNRVGYYLGHNLASNTNYTITAMPVSHPMTKESVLLVKSVDNSNDLITNFRLSQNEVAELKEQMKGEPLEIIKKITKQLSRNVTRIYGRWDLHAIVDLVFHTPLHLSFNGVALPKSAFELLLMGDTRTGKGTIVEGIIGYYDLGEVVSGENISYMGLVGGANKVYDHFQLNWGAIPLNHGRLLAIDEFSGIQSDILGRLSRVRSEGIAEIDKGGIHSRTPACARLIWISNPRKGKEIEQFAYGIESILDLVQTQEDIARFDLAVIVSKNEVSPEEMNKQSPAIEDFYSQETLRKIILWVWSRKPEQTKFSKEATEFILDAALKLSGRYSPSIPLVQAENVRFKIAKLSAAVAARVFSCSEDGEEIRVDKGHTQLAVKLIQHFYDKESMGYLQYSYNKSSSKKLTRLEELRAFFKQFKEDQRLLLINGLLGTDNFGVREMQDWINVEGGIAKRFVGILVRSNAIHMKDGTYVKNGEFIKFLQIQRTGIK